MGEGYPKVALRINKPTISTIAGFYDEYLIDKMISHRTMTMSLVLNAVSKLCNM